MTHFPVSTEGFFSMQTTTFLHANFVSDRERFSVYDTRRVENQERRINANRVSTLHSVGCNSHSEWIRIHLVCRNENPSESASLHLDVRLPRKLDGTHGSIQSSIRWLGDAPIPSCCES